MKRVFDLVIFFLFLPISIFSSLLIVTVILPLKLIFKHNIFSNFSDWFYESIIPFQRKQIIKRIEKGAHILDVGAGSCYLAKTIVQKKKAWVTCLDIADFNKTDLPLVIFDGVHLPCKDKTYDFVILSYVLHHAQAQKKLLKECARVCRGKTLVLEDKPVLAKSLFARIHQAVFNFFYNSSGRITYHSPQEWRDIFKECGFRILEEEDGWGVGAVLASLKKVVFVLKPY